MHIQYYGLSCVKLTMKPGGRGTDDVVIVANPFKSDADLRSPKLANADVVMSCADTDMYWSQAAGKSGAVAITMPGEYAVKGAHIVGNAVKSTEGKKSSVIFVVEAEGLKVGVITGIDVPLKAKHFEELNGTHILIIAIGGEDVIDSVVASDIIRKIEPAYVIPVQYAIDGVSTTKQYANTDVLYEKLGVTKQDSVQKVVLKESECIDQKTDIILMQP